MRTPVPPEELQNQSPPKKVTWKVLPGPILRSLVIVTATYTLTAAGMYFGMGGPDDLTKGIREISEEVESLGMILLFTAGYAMIPVLAYAVFLQEIREARDIAGPIREVREVGGCILWCILAFFFVHTGFWFGLPIIFLAFLSGWLNLIWAAVHIALARPGHRITMFIEYGATSFALLLFLGGYTEARFFPYGLLIVVAQAAMLTVVDWVCERFLVPSHALNKAVSKQG